VRVPTDACGNGSEAGTGMILSKSIAIDGKELSQPADGTHSGSLDAASREFLKRLWAGESAAFDILVTRHSGEIYGLLFRLTGDTEEAADLTQETFLQALRAINTFRGDADLKTWLFRIAVNKSRNRFRWWKRRKRESTVSLDLPIGSSERTYQDVLPDRSESPEAAVLRVERESRLRRAMNKLASTYREALVLRDIHGLSYEEVAEALDVNIGTVKSRIARGREELRKQLTDF